MGQGYPEQHWPMGARSVVGTGQGVEIVGVVRQAVLARIRSEEKGRKDNCGGIVLATQHYTT